MPTDAKSEGVTAYPLVWPDGWQRTTWNAKKAGKFNATMASARDHLMREVKLLGAKLPIISSNLFLRMDGLPYATQRQPTDVGVALYFTLHNRPMCFACDRYKRVEDNIRAIGLTIEALRGMERWGASDMMERAFTGFAQLEHKPLQHWWEVLDVPANATRDVIELSYKRLRSRHHPDRPSGNAEVFHTIQGAYEKAMENFQ